MPEAKALLEQFKHYGKIESEAEDETVLIPLLEAAMETLWRSGVPEDTDTPLFRLAVCRMALHYYEFPEEAANTAGQMPMGLNWMIEQLRYGE